MCSVTWIDPRRPSVLKECEVTLARRRNIFYSTVPCTPPSNSNVMITARDSESNPPVEASGACCMQFTIIFNKIVILYGPGLEQGYKTKRVGVYAWIYEIWGNVLVYKIILHITRIAFHV